MKDEQFLNKNNKLYGAFGTKVLMYAPVRYLAGAYGRKIKWQSRIAERSQAVQ